MMSKLNILRIEFSCFVANTRAMLVWRAADMLPHWLVRAALIRAGAHATTGNYSHTVAPTLTLMATLERWETSNV